jgi:hypothetical protein
VKKPSTPASSVSGIKKPKGPKDGKKDKDRKDEGMTVRITSTGLSDLPVDRRIN